MMTRKFHTDQARPGHSRRPHFVLCMRCGLIIISGYCDGSTRPHPQSAHSLTGFGLPSNTWFSGPHKSPLPAPNSTTIGHVTLTTPFSETICHRQAGTCYG